MLRHKGSVFFIAQGAVIAAIYVVLTIALAPFSFKEVQIRIAEALTILPIFTPAAVPGLAVGCLLANLIGGAPLPDVIFGSLATALGAAGTRILRKRMFAIAVIPPIAANMLIIPFVLCYAYGVPLPIPLMMGTVGAGELVSCGILGGLLYKALEPHRRNVFNLIR